MHHLSHVDDRGSDDNSTDITMNRTDAAYTMQASFRAWFDQIVVRSHQCQLAYLSQQKGDPPKSIELRIYLHTEHKDSLRSRQQHHSWSA